MHEAPTPGQDQPRQAAAVLSAPTAGCATAPASGTGRDRGRLAWIAGVGGLAGVFIVPALVQTLAEPPGHPALELTLVAALAVGVLFLRLLRRFLRADGVAQVPWLQLTALATLAIGLATRGTTWVQTLALATFLLALYLVPRAAGPAVAALSGVAGLLAAFDGGSLTAALTIAFAAAIMGGFGFLTRRSTVMSAQLRATEQELARIAAADERLRIARELHDLLGHSLSLIALKAELVHTLLPQEAEGTRREVTDIEAVARRCLDDVRHTVTGYRRADLTAELALARRTTAAAGIDCRIEMPGQFSLPQEVDSLLAWSVREATTNVIRHSDARSCTIRLAIDGGVATGEVIDDGIGPLNSYVPGAGLAGLAERAGHLGGKLDVSVADKHGFRLRVRVPVQELE